MIAKAITVSELVDNCISNDHVCNITTKNLHVQIHLDDESVETIVVYDNKDNVLATLKLHENGSITGIPHKCNTFTINKTQTGYFSCIGCDSKLYEINIHTVNNVPDIRETVEDAKYLITFLVAENDKILESGISVYL